MIQTTEQPQEETELNELVKKPKKTKKPKETDKIKEFLESYGKLQRRIDNQEARLEYLKLMEGSPSSPNLSGMPTGSRDGSSKQERDTIKKTELEEKLCEMYADENRIREEIEELIKQMKDPDEQTVIEMHYLDGAKWWPICAALFENEPDYDENERRYLKKTFKIHGSALQTLSKIHR